LIKKDFVMWLIGPNDNDAIIETSGRETVNPSARHGVRLKFSLLLSFFWEFETGQSAVGDVAGCLNNN
jgi:hypothetical protein